MNARTIPWLVVMAYLSASCSASSAWIEPRQVDLEPAPAAALLPCEVPQPAPDDLADLNAGQQGALWAADRVNLANCGAQHWVLIQWAKAVQVSFDGMRANDLRFTTRSVTY